ncbi:MAG: transcriptional repressor LexA [Chloroflexi bacterium]|nr:transcriptional repressor LexA [Chloroflexota bacterium]MCL5025807.1 transcriptional repressor LexA [Chloroflexota bacterium]
MEKMPLRRRSVLKFVRQHVDEKGFPPSVREIGRAVGISSTSVVDFHLRALEAAGYIRRARDISRGIEVLPNGNGDTRPSSSPSIPIMGRIAAGVPIEALPTDVEPLSMPPYLAESLDPSKLFALYVKGDSMVDELIGDGDLVIVHRQSTARDGDIVVALLTNTPTDQWGATLKRFYHEGDRIRLQPANPAMAPIYVSPDELRIQGKVVALVRRF